MATTKELLQQSQKAIGDYFELSKYLFGDDAPQDVNEIPTDSPFYPSAKAIAEEMGVSWDTMTPDQSNRVMLNLLADYFFRIQVGEEYKPVLKISFLKAD